MATQTNKIRDLGFDRLAAVHRGAMRSYWLYAVLLLLIGLAFIIGALTGHLNWVLGIVTGIVALAVAILPIRDAIERSERIEGLSVLEEEWRALVDLGDTAAGERDQFMALMRRLYS